MLCVRRILGQGMNKRKTGTYHEQMAAKYLIKKGYRILEQNYRSRFGELDIVAWDRGTLVIVEVKYRRGSICGTPAESVDWRKQRKICHVTMDFIMRHRLYYNKPCRFDVIEVYGAGEICHIEAAFDFSCAAY